MDDLMPDIDSMIDILHQYADNGNLVAAQNMAERIHTVEDAYGKQLRQSKCELYTTI